MSRNSTVGFSGAACSSKTVILLGAEALRSEPGTKRVCWGPRAGQNRPRLKPLIQSWPCMKTQEAILEELSSPRRLLHCHSLENSHFHGLLKPRREREEKLLLFSQEHLQIEGEKGKTVWLWTGMSPFWFKHTEPIDLPEGRVTLSQRNKSMARSLALDYCLSFNSVPTVRLRYLAPAWKLHIGVPADTRCCEGPFVESWSDMPSACRTTGEPWMCYSQIHIQWIHEPVAEDGGAQCEIVDQALYEKQVRCNWGWDSRENFLTLYLAADVPLVRSCK